MPQQVKPKKTYVSVRMTPKLKNIPKGHTGYTSRTVVVGLESSVELWQLIVCSAKEIADFYVDTMNPSQEEFQEQIKKAASWVANIAMKDE